MPEAIIRSASLVRFFDREGGPSYAAAVLVTRPPGQGLDLLVRDHSAGLGVWAEVRRVLHRDRPERAAGAPYWLPIAD